VVHIISKCTCIESKNVRTFGYGYQAHPQIKVSGYRESQGLCKSAWHQLVDAGENYFEVIAEENQKVPIDLISPFVKSLGGTTLPEGFDERQSYRDHIQQKHA